MKENIFQGHLELKVKKQPNCLKRGKTRVTKSRLLLVLQMIDLSFEK